MRFLAVLVLLSGCVRERLSLQQCMELCRPLEVHHYSTDYDVCDCTSLPKCK